MQVQKWQPPAGTAAPKKRPTTATQASGFNFPKSKIKIYIGVDAIIVLILNFDKFCSISAILRLFDDGSDNTTLLPSFLLKIRSLRILDMIVCSGPLVWLFSPA